MSWFFSLAEFYPGISRDYIISIIPGALKDFDKTDKKTPGAEGESSKQSDSTAAALADLPPGWNDEFLKFVFLMKFS